MKANTLLRYQYTADLYDFNEVPVAGGTGTTKQFFFSREVKVKLYFGAGDGPVVYCSEPLAVGMRLLNIRTVNGELLRPTPTSVQGYQYEIFSSEPVLNGFGFRDSYRYETTRS